MTIDMDRLSEAELIDRNRRIVERLRFIREARAHQAMLQFRIGERVWFELDGGGRVEGIITRYNRKSVSVLAEDCGQWRVAPGFLRKLEIQADRDTAGTLERLPPGPDQGEGV